MFLKDGEMENQGLSEDTDNREIFTIDEAIEFTTAFFRPIIKN